MGLFVIGDIHACFKTFVSVLNHWNREKETLIQVGDIIDRGNFNPQTIKLCRELQSKHNAIFLKGNHELLLSEYYSERKNERWMQKYGRKVLWQYMFEGIDHKDDFAWIASLPSYWENEKVFISHAGIGHSSFCMDEGHPDGLLWNRGEIKNIQKMQIYGHTPLKSGIPEFYAESNSWNIDTGVYTGRSLSALRINNEGEVTEKIIIPTISDDIK